MGIKQRLFTLILLLFTLLLSGCASLYFEPAGAQPEVAPEYDFSTLPFDEYWTGIVFNGNKIGFSHLKISPDPQLPGITVLESEAIMVFRMLGFDKKIILKSRDRVRPDLSLKDFSYDYYLDGNEMQLQGATEFGGLRFTRKAGDEAAEIFEDFAGTIYPASVLGLFPVFEGLEVGRSFRYTVFDGETMSLNSVDQEILAYERSELFTGAAYKVRSRMHGQEVETWVNHKGLPVLEMAMGGVFISGLESETMAKNYLAEAALNKSEAFLEFSLVKVEEKVNNPRQVTAMTLSLTGAPDDFEPLLATPYQSCRNQNGLFSCRTTAHGSLSDDEQQGQELARRLGLMASHTVPKDNDEIRELAMELARETETAGQKIEKILIWMTEHIDKTPADVFSALDVLHSRKAECQGHAFLFAALARAMEMPTRVVNGIVYSEPYGGFLFHTWVEVLTEQNWQPVDPTFNQMQADATHLKFVEGEGLHDLAPLVDLVGKLKVVEIKTE